jgi:hypothetical protein
MRSTSLHFRFINKKTCHLLVIDLKAQQCPLSVLPRGRNFVRKSQKGPQKNLRAKKLAAEFLPDFYEKSRKGAELFRNSFLRDNLWIF